MRRLRPQYADVLRGRLHRDGPLGVIALGQRWLRAAASRTVGRPLVGPALGTLILTYRCNLRCRVCDLPLRAAARRRAGWRELDTRAFEKVLRDMKAIGTGGVGVTGGEPMLRPDVLHLLAYGDRLGLHMHLNTDGFRVADVGRDLVRTGVRSVNISLDGPNAEVHDAARGRSGSYADVVRAFEALRRARGRSDRPRLTAVTVITTHNVDQIDAVAAAAREAGADCLGFVPVHDFGQREPTVDGDAVARGQDSLRHLHEVGFLDNSLAYVDLLPRALAGRESPLVCHAPYTSAVVDCYGDVYACFPLMERKEPLGRIPLQRLWRSRTWSDARTRLASCRACLWNCHTELNLVLPQVGRVGRAG